MTMFTTLWNRIRRWWYRRAAIGDTIFWGSACVRVVGHCATHSDQPELEGYQVLYTHDRTVFPCVAFVAMTEYQVLVHPTPPTALTGLNRLLYHVYTWCWFRTPAPSPGTPLHFHETRAYDDSSSCSTFRTFAALPIRARILYWRPLWGRWFLHVGTIAQAQLSVLEYQDVSYPTRCFKLANGHIVDPAYVYQDGLPPELSDLRYTYSRNAADRFAAEHYTPEQWVTLEADRHMAPWFP